VEWSAGNGTRSDNAAPPPPASTPTCSMLPSLAKSITHRQLSWRGAWGRLRVHAQVAQQPGYDGYLGVEAAMAGDGCERKFQHALSGRTHGKQSEVVPIALLITWEPEALGHINRTG
jgi:hypothetical protein